MPSVPRITVVIPTYNNEKTLDETIQSVLNQDYGLENLYFCFVDFGSTDSTVEKIMELPGRHCGLFSLAGRPRGRTARARALMVQQSQSVPGRAMTLWPGDVLRQDCISSLERQWNECTVKEKCRLGYIVTEVDILEDNGSISSPPSLFTAPTLLRGFSAADIMFYVDRGWRRQILRYAPSITSSIDKVGTYTSHVRYWNQMGYTGMFVDVLYLPDRLIRQRRYKPPDELDELLFHFEMALTCFRMAREQPQMYVTGQNFEAFWRASLGKYALWRSWLTRQRGETKTAEDLFLMASVIHPGMETGEAWRRMERWLAHAGEEDAAWLQTWFAQEENSSPPPPPLPFGGMVRRLLRKWRLRRMN